MITTRGLAPVVLAVALTACGGSEGPAPQAPAPSAEPAADSPAEAAPQTAAECPPKVVENAGQSGGTCLEAAVLGDDVVAACSQWFLDQSYTRDPDAEAMIGGQTGKTLVCFRAP